MTDSICSKAQINQIAGELNSGHRDAAMHDLNVCTMDLINGSDYTKNMKTDLAAMLSGDGPATTRMQSNFEAVAKDERQLWQSVIDTAQKQNPHGLCQLSIVEDKDAGPHSEINGASCR